MILTCPSCGTQYVIKDGAIPPSGRQVRCASCKHSWHQDPETPPDSEPEPATGREDETIAEAGLIDPSSGPEAEQRAYDEATINGEAGVASPVGPEEAPAEPNELAPAPGFAAVVAVEPLQPEVEEDDFGPFPEREDEAGPRRPNRIVGLMLVVVVVAALAAAFWFLAPPEWKARIGLTGDDASPLALVTTHMDRQRLESGNELLTVTGRVINPTGESQQVPPLQAELRTRTGQVVYSWTIAPPARSLPPGASASFNSAEVNVPPGGDELTITLGSPRA